MHCNRPRRRGSGRPKTLYNAKKTVEYLLVHTKEGTNEIINHEQRTMTNDDEEEAKSNDDDERTGIRRGGTNSAPSSSARSSSSSSAAAASTLRQPLLSCSRSTNDDDGANNNDTNNNRHTATTTTTRRNNNTSSSPSRTSRTEAPTPPPEAFDRFRRPRFDNNSNFYSTNGGTRRSRSVVNNSNNNDNDDDNDDDDNDRNDEIEYQLEALQLLGRPYASYSEFWFPSLLAVALLGACSAFAGLLFLGATVGGQALWLRVSLEPPVTARGDPRWLLITTAGGLFAGLILWWLMPRNRRRSLGSGRTFFHSAKHLTGNTDSLRETVAAFVSSCIAIATGAPLGPEQAMGTASCFLASQMAERYSNFWWGCCGRRGNGYPAAAAISRRTQATWVHAGGLAAAIGAFFPSPLLGALLAHELGVAGRPDRLGFDALVAAEKQRTSRDASTAAEAEDGATQQPEERQTTTRATTTTTVAREAAEAARSFDPSNQHDYMEALTLAVVACTVSSAVVRALVPSLKDLHAFAPASTLHQFEAWHLLAAIPLGISSAVLGSLFPVLNAVARQVCSRLSHQLEAVGAPEVLPFLLFPALAGLIHGSLALLCPHAEGSSMAAVRDLWNHAVAAAAAGQDTGEPLLPTRVLFGSAVAKMISMSLCMGLGLVGGPVLPAIHAGFLWGLAWSQLFPALPPTLTILCCTAACPAAFCPIVVTLVLAVALLLQCSAEQTGPMLVAATVSWTLTGGLGILQRKGQEALTRNTHDGTAQATQDYNDAQQQQQREPSDSEILQDIREAIFGGGSSDA